MLVEGFYNIDNAKISNNEIEASISLNIEHPIYKGHFPDQPVVPGVMLLQIVKEILEKTVNSKLFVKRIKQIKYYAPVIPEHNSNLIFKIQYKSSENIIVKFTISSDQQTFSKGSLDLTFPKSGTLEKLKKEKPL